jgi:hypothetical protein
MFLQKTITWTKKIGKGQQKWHKTCELTMVPPRKIKTLVKTCFAARVVLFQKIFLFKHVIALGYGNQQSLDLEGHVPNP